MIDSKKIEVVLIIESPDLVSIINSSESLKKYQLKFFTDGIQALSYLVLTNNNARLVILSDHISSINGFEIIKKTKEAGFKYNYLFISDIESISNALKAIQAGAIDYIVINKNIENELPQIIEKKLETLNSVFEYSNNSMNEEKNRLEKVLQARLRISIFALTHTLNELVRTIIDEAELLTRSNIGFFHFLDKDQISLTRQTWSTNTLMNMCSAESEGDHSTIESAGVWVDCIRFRKPIIHNDYKSLPHRKGLPDGHATIVRELVVPIFEGDLIVAILGLGNKESDYNDTDIDTVNQLTYFAWDIIKSKRTEEALRQSEERYRYMFENNPQPMFIYDLESLFFVQVNNAIIEHYGYSNEEFLSMTLKDIHFTEDMDILWIDIEKAKQTYNPAGEWRHKKKNGELIYVEILSHTVTFNNRKARHVLIKDITEAKRAKEALIESEFFFKESQRAAFVGSYKTNFIAGYWESSEVLDQIFGIDKNFNRSVQGWVDIIHPDDREMMDKYLSEAVLTRHEPFNKEYRIIRKSDGETRWVIGLGDIDFDTNGTVISMIGTIQDITIRKRAEEALQEREEQLRLLFNISPDALFLINENGRFTDANQVAINRYEFSLEEFLTMTPTDIAAPDLKEKVIEQLIESIHKENHFEWVHCTKGGHMFPVEIHSKPIKINDKPFIFVEVRDITERKKTEESLTQLNNQLIALNNTKDKLFSIIAHDLKSPFNSILGYSELLINNLQNYTSKKVEEFVSQINSSARITLALIENLLAWANSQMGQIDYKPEKLELLPIIQDVIELLGSTAKIKNITIQYFQAEDFTVYADKNMIQIIIRNLISNAIKFSNIDGKINVYSILDHNQIEITVSDNGVGMSEKFRKNLFKNNHTITTKGTANEKGSGLGLILCKEFVEKQGGKIWVESELGIGCDFKFSLPKI